MKLAERLDTASSFFFFAGFIISQLQRSPFATISALSNIGALLCYSIAYGLWLFACQLYPDYPRKKDYWYGFAEVKQQHLVAAVIGTAAIICCVVGILFPVFLVPASWLFFASNVIWCISEYHKEQNPPHDEKYSQTQQSAYVRYAVINTIMTLVPAVTATIALFFPPAALLAFVASTIMGICLGSLALYCWIEYNNLSPELPQKGSYVIGMESLGGQQGPSNSCQKESPKTNYSRSLWHTSQRTTSELEGTSPNISSRP